MAYVQQYRIPFSNTLGESGVIDIYKKDGSVVTIREYPITSLEINCNGADDVDGCIITREALFRIFVPLNDSFIDWFTFIATANDEWKVIITIDGQYIFHGFIIPDESPTDFQDKPYELTIRCSDGLKLLKQITLTDIDNNPFTCSNDNNVTDLMSYVCACLAKTNLNLQIKLYCNIYESSYPNRNDDPLADAFNNTKLDRRAFSKSATEMGNCYDVLTAILQDGFRLGYDAGYWKIKRIGEFQYQPGDNWYTLYNPDRTVYNAQIDTEDWSPVGKEQITRPVRKDAQVSKSE